MTQTACVSSCEHVAAQALDEVRGQPRPSLLARIVEGLLTWQERADQRHHLAALDDRMLRDIGLSHADAEREIRKPFWRA